MNKAFRVLRMVLENPINRNARADGIIRFFRWQIGSWLVPGKVLIPWINGSRIFSDFMMSGSAGCAYSGLHEFEEMAFVLHFLRKEDLFMDVGANVGVFSVLAGSAVGASCVSVEPGDEAYVHLQDNILINRMQDRVQAVKACISDEDAVCQFANSAESTLSHITFPSEDAESTTKVQTRKIDTVLCGRVPAMLKIDVEGFEKQALEGASHAMAENGLNVILLELGLHSARYGVQPEEIHRLVTSFGFEPCYYDPFLRRLTSLESYDPRGNTLYVRNREFVASRLESASTFTVFGQVL